MWGTWSEGVLYGEQKGTHPKKVKFFGKFLFSVTTIYFGGNKRRLAKNR